MNMDHHVLGPLIDGDKIVAELKRRRSKDVYQIIRGSNKKLISDKVKLEKDDGWRVVKTNEKSTRMARPKPDDEQLEDEVWCILAQMGFKEMSNGRQFTIKEFEGVPPRQIDVFCKDDESAIIVECTHRVEPGKKRLTKLIEKIKAIREPIRKSVVAHYSRQHAPKLKFVIATKNIEWSDVDLEKCREADIGVITDRELEYYTKLVKLMRRAARYQFLAHMFAGKVAGLANEVVATKGRMGDKPFYMFTIKPDELLKIAYVGHKGSRDVEDLETYQRMLVPSRLRKIATFINNGGKFPTNIVVNLKVSKPPKFDRIEKVGEETVGRLLLPAQYAAAWIIDGQHRLYGYAFARELKGYNHDKSRISVLAYENLPAEDEMNLFIDINSKQVKVNKGLLSEIYADLHWKSDDQEQAFLALHSRLSGRLNVQKSSPLFERMAVTGKAKSNFRCLTLTSISDGLKESKLIGNHSRGVIQPGPFSTHDPLRHDANLRKGLSLVSECLKMFSDAMPEHWKLGASPGGYLCTNIGLRALFHVFKDVADHIQYVDGTDLRVMNAEDAFAAMKPILQHLVDYFKDASANDILAFRQIGSSLSLVQQQAWGMEAQIYQKLDCFKPSGMLEYLASRDVKGTEEAATKVRRVNERLFKFVIRKLQEEFGADDDRWWIEGVPTTIRVACAEEWEKKDREGSVESCLFLRHYTDIAIENWEIFKNVISLDAKDKEAKKQNVKWIHDLNKISQTTKHPEKGALSADQVARVNELYALVEVYFPSDP